jgi:hypothetical protein
MADVLKLSGYKIQKLDAATDSINALEIVLGATTFTETTIATLDGSGKLPSSQLPAIAITNVSSVADIASRDALTPASGDVAIVTDDTGGSIGSGNASYIYDGAAWQLLKSGDSVLSVNGEVGAITLNPDHLDDAATAHKFASQAQLDKVDFLTITAARDIDAIVSADGSISSHSDVDPALAPTDGQVLKYNFLNSQFEAADESGGAAQLSELSDVDAAMAPSDGQFLKYSGTNTQFESVTVSSDDISEGVTNFYFTDAKAEAAILSGHVASGDGTNTVANTDSIGVAIEKLDGAVIDHESRVSALEGLERESLVLGEATSANTVVYVKEGNGDLFIADKDLPMSRQEIAMIYFDDVGGPGGAINVIKPGQVIPLAGTKGNFGYLGDNGAIVTSAPVGAGEDVVVLGYWKSTSEFVFKPEYLATN